MIKIAFCDDDSCMLNEFHTLFDQYCTTYDHTMESSFFQSSLDLLAALERGVRFDILFLDVLMPGQNGIDTAAEIRNYDSNVKIIFLSSSSDFAVASYTVGAYFYQLKPLSKDTFFHLMDSVISTLEKEQSKSILLQCKDGITRIELSELEYCEVFHRTLYIYLTNGTVLKSSGSMDELYRQLQSYGGFLRPHRSYLVNLKHVQTLSYQSITMKCLAKIPIPRGKYQELKNTYLEYAFHSMDILS